MGKIQVKRITLTDSTTFEEIEFDSICGRYFVKNFTDGDIYVSFDEDATANDSVKIPSGYYQEVIANDYLGGLESYKTTSIFVMGEGEIEVQQLCYHTEN